MDRVWKQIELDYSDILVAIFELMLKGGLSSRDLLAACVGALEHAEQKSRSNQRHRDNGLVAPALVLDAWHRDRRYLTARGAPKAVRLWGSAPSVEALVRRQKIKEQTGDVIQSLKAFRLLVPCGKRLYKPASDVAVVSARDPLILQHAARSLSTLLETVGQNVRETSNVPRLIERVAEVPDLPRKEVRAFRAFTQSQGRTFIRTVNDWLESRRVRTPKKRENDTVRAGIHTYAYIAPRDKHPLRI